MGTPLTEQLDTLKEKLRVYETVYDAGHIIWDKVKLTVDKPITWDEYLALEARLLDALIKEDIPLKQRIYDASDSLFADLKQVAVQDGMPPNGMDKKFLAGLFALYFPNSTRLAHRDVHFNGVKFALELALKPPSFKVENKSYSFEKLASFPWAKDQEIDDLLTRFIFSRVFGKWYFGGGFAQLSVIAGFHHLALLLALIKLHAAGLAIARGANEVSMIDIMQTVRQAEEKISVAVLDGYSAGLWELILFSRQRVHRVLDACFV